MFANDPPENPENESLEELQPVGAERLLTLSDGVFAIAITLLVLSVTVPKVDNGLWAALRHQWPQYLSYVESFLIIGIIWAQHHQMFRHIKRVDHIFLLINIVFLMWIASLPFPTELLGNYLTKSGPEQTAMAIYAGTFVFGGMLFNLLWRYATWGRRLTGDSLNEDSIRRITQSYNLGMPLYLIDFALAFINVWASLLLFIVIALFYALAPLVHWDTERFSRSRGRAQEE